MSKKSGSRVQRYLFAGVLTAIPLWITWIVLSFLFRQLSSLGDPWVRALANTVARTSPPLAELLIHPWLQPVLATVLILIGLYILGRVSTRVIGRQLVNAVENLIDRIPLVEKIYGATRKIISTLNQQDRKMDRVVLIDFPNETMKTVGFVTRIIRERNSGREMAAVYVPTTPNPTSGYLEIIPTERLINTDMTVEQAMTFIVSGGTVGPDEILFDRGDGLMQAVVQAQPNIALVKYWGKKPQGGNVPATPSLSITLDTLWTRTRVSFSRTADQDRFTINDKQDLVQQQRVVRCLDDIRRVTGTALYADVQSKNNFPTGAGLASSASGFAALVAAACAALGADLDLHHQSRLARRGSASAARSVFGGFVELDNTDPDPAARPLLEQGEWPLQVLVALTSTTSKSVGSTQGMVQSAATSEFYPTWTTSARDDFSAARKAVLARDFQALAEISEASCLKMHGVMLSTRPALVYWNGATVDIIHRVRELRSQGTPAFFTIDAGPQVKIVTETESVDEIRKVIEEIPGVIDIIPGSLGAGARIVDTY